MRIALLHLPQIYYIELFFIILTSLAISQLKLVNKFGSLKFIYLAVEW